MHVGAGRNAVRDEAVERMCGNVAVEGDRGAGDVRDHGLRRCRAAVDLERAVAGDRRGRARILVRRLRAEHEHVADVAVPALEVRTEEVVPVGQHEVARRTEPGAVEPVGRARVERPCAECGHDAVGRVDTGAGRERDGDRRDRDEVGRAAEHECQRAERQRRE